MAGHDSRTIYFAAQLGKYVPGSVWPAVIQARLGRRNVVGGTTMLISYAIWMGVLCAVGAVTSALVLTNGDMERPPGWSSRRSASRARRVAAVRPRPRPPSARHLGGPTQRPPHRGPRIRRDAGRLAVLLSAATWLAFGVHAWVLARPLGADPADLPLVVGAFALAFVAGVVVVPLPAGAGVRETILVLTLGARSAGREPSPSRCCPG